jgi:hypothetical protein
MSITWLIIIAISAIIIIGFITGPRSSSSFREQRLAKQFDSWSWSRAANGDVTVRTTKKSNGKVQSQTFRASASHPIGQVPENMRYFVRQARNSKIRSKLSRTRVIRVLPSCDCYCACVLTAVRLPVTVIGTKTPRNEPNVVRQTD